MDNDNTVENTYDTIHKDIVEREFDITDDENRDVSTLDNNYATNDILHEDDVDRETMAISQEEIRNTGNESESVKNGTYVVLLENRCNLRTSRKINCSTRFDHVMDNLSNNKCYDIQLPQNTVTS